MASWQQWAKKLSEESSAVLLMNNGDAPQTVTLHFEQVPAFATKGVSASTPFALRNVWDHTDLGVFAGSYEVTLAPHDSAFLVATVQKH